MRAKEIFMEAYKAQREIKRLESRRQHYLEMAIMVAGMSETNIRSTEKRSRTESAAIGLATVAEKLKEPAEQYLRAVRKAEEIIGQLEKPRHREVLSLHYLEGLPWAEVSDRMGYQDPKSVFRVHGWALMAADKILVGR